MDCFAMANDFQVVDAEAGLAVVATSQHSSA